MRQKRYTTIFHAQRFDRDDEFMMKDMLKHREEASMVGLTEIHGRMPLIREGPWGACSSNDAATSWDSAVWKDIARQPEVYERQFKGAKGDVHNDKFGNPMVVLEDRETLLRVAWTALHFPAAVEGNWFRRVARRVAHQWLFLKSRKALRKLASEHGAHVLMISADVNLNWNLKWVQAYANSYFPNWTFIWEAKPFPYGWTHAGKRLIDWIWAMYVRVHDAEIKPPTKASDHRAIKMTWSAIGQKKIQKFRK